MLRIKTNLKRIKLKLSSCCCCCKKKKKVHKTYSPIAANTEREWFIEPAVVAFPVQKGLAKHIQFLWMRLEMIPFH